MLGLYVDRDLCVFAARRSRILINCACERHCPTRSFLGRTQRFHRETLPDSPALLEDARAWTSGRRQRHTGVCTVRTKGGWD